MRILTIAIAVLGALSFSSCDNPVADTDIHDLGQVRKRSEYILLCVPDYSGTTVRYRLREVIYKNPATSVPWTIGDFVAALGFEVDPNLTEINRTIIYYEEYLGETRSMAFESFTVPASGRAGTQLEARIATLKKL